MKKFLVAITLFLICASLVSTLWAIRLRSLLIEEGNRLEELYLGSEGDECVFQIYRVENGSVATYTHLGSVLQVMGKFRVTCGEGWVSVEFLEAEYEISGLREVSRE